MDYYSRDGRGLLCASLGRLGEDALGITITGMTSGCYTFFLVLFDV